MICLCKMVRQRPREDSGGVLHTRRRESAGVDQRPPAMCLVPRLGALVAALCSSLLEKLLASIPLEKAVLVAPLVHAEGPVLLEQAAEGCCTGQKRNDRGLALIVGLFLDNGQSDRGLCDRCCRSLACGKVGSGLSLTLDDRGPPDMGSQSRIRVRIRRDQNCRRNRFSFTHHFCVGGCAVSRP